uniref:Uncharacterized protein n=1 Tax=Arundo donax TaxID=35708 RepID=A0A0A9F2G8_ARUDO
MVGSFPAYQCTVVVVFYLFVLYFIDEEKKVKFRSFFQHKGNCKSIVAWNNSI